MRQDDALGDAEIGAGQDDLVDRLDRLAGTDRTDVGDRLAHRVEDRPGTLDVVLVAADEDRQGRLLGTLAATRDRGIDHRRGRARAGAWRSPSSPTARWSSNRRRGCPRARPRPRPSGPNRTASTSGVSETQMTTMSAAAAASAGVAATRTPSSASSGARPGVRFQAVTGKAGTGQVGGHGRAHRPEPEERDAACPAWSGRSCRGSAGRPGATVGVRVRRLDGVGLASSTGDEEDRRGADDAWPGG